ncbi:MAG: RNA methyltransferase [Flavobacteriales bacterium]|nr:RNA methyltransferase [Flavobacteriales bacterium]MBO72642.1 RNA methyltransferase [Flavobacteriales bacterium]|tara:strand:+ start:14185 stop:14922 length:738 start_codon:yes stop_codon:yes gene_type:complete
MLSKNKIKFIKSLQQKKNRIQSDVFVVEGRKGVLSLLNSDFEIKEIYCSESALKKSPDLNALNPTIADELSIEKASGLKSNKEAIAVVSQKLSEQINWNKTILFLDGISDPGNLGTIIRTIDWFGIDQVVCSEECVEFYNPKVIQSTMGSFSRKIPVVKTVESFLREKPKGVRIFLTCLNGESLDAVSSMSSGVLVMGSESHGVSNLWETTEHTKITIASSPNSKADSLNVAVATSILCFKIKQG